MGSRNLPADFEEGCELWKFASRFLRSYYKGSDLKKGVGFRNLLIDFEKVSRRR